MKSFYYCWLCHILKLFSVVSWYEKAKHILLSMPDLSYFRLLDGSCELFLHFDQMSKSFPTIKIIEIFLLCIGSTVTGIYQQLKSFWSCSHINCGLQNILQSIYIFYILLYMSRQVEKFMNHENPTST